VDRLNSVDPVPSGLDSESPDLFVPDAAAPHHVSPSERDYPIRLASPTDFATVRALFTSAGYDEATVARRLGGQTLIGVPRLADGRRTLADHVEDALSALIRLFIDGCPLPSVQLHALLGSEAFAALESLGLLLAPDDPSMREPTVQLLPLQGLWIASDPLPHSVKDLSTIRQDFVYSAHNELTGSFLSFMPAAAGARVLDMCAGTGVAALRAVASGAASATAADLIPRSAHFARFNALLNGLGDRVTVVESDVWSALAGEQYDLIVAHPPYVPALSHRFDFRDAGVDGEHVTRKLVEGVPDHLRRGGRLLIRAALTDRGGRSIAQRVREWLGAASDEFDLVQLESMEYGLLDAYKGVTKGGKDFVDCERWLRQFTALEIDRFALCFLELRRDAYGRPPITERRKIGAALGPEVSEWHFQFARFLAGGGATSAARMGGQRPRVVPQVRAAVHLEAQADGGWQTVGATVETAWPTHGLVKAPPLAPTLLELCDGTRTVGDVLAELRTAGLVTEEVGLEEVARLIEVLANAAALELAACPLPPRPQPAADGVKRG